MSFQVISFGEGDPLLDWRALTDAIVQGHKRPKAEIEDIFLYRGKDTLLSRAAWIDGLGQLVKTATIFPANSEIGKPVINGTVSLFSDDCGELEAVIDFHLVTKWKTAADSLLAAKRLARKDSRRILVVGSGQVASTMIDAYRSHFEAPQITVWSRNTENAQKLASRKSAEVASDLQEAVTCSDIICTATMASSPVIKGDWLQPGQHLDLIGAYRPDMREVDDVALQKARVFVDSFATTLGHIGELKIPLETGAIGRSDVLADFYDMDHFSRQSENEITICKNGGGAHLDLMTSRHILDAFKSS